MRCASCGHENRELAADRRCASCGLIVEPPRPQTAAERDKRFVQGRFSAAWFLVAIAIATALTLAVVLGLPFIVRAFDFEGYAGMMVAVGVWFVSGMLVGLVSPGRTFAEPAVAVLVVAMPTAILLFRTQTVKAMPAFMYLLFAALGVLFALVGSYIGERFQEEPDTSDL